MFQSFARQFARSLSTTASKQTKIALLGASGGIGQPMSLLLKKASAVGELSLYDIAHVKGVAADLSHIETNAKVRGYQGKDELEPCLVDSEIVVIPAGVPRKPGMTRDDLFNTNASIVADLVYACGKFCPNANICIITNPVNSTVPIAAEMLKKLGVYNPNRLFGVTTLDVVRAITFVAEKTNTDCVKLDIPVIGGHSGVTIIPVLSQCKPSVQLSQEDVEALTARIQDAGTEVVKAKAGTGSATLSMAFAGVRFVKGLLTALKNKPNIVECGFTESNVVDGVDFFSTPLKLGIQGLEQNLGLPPLNSYEQSLVDKAVPELQKNIEAGRKFALDYTPK